MTAKQVLIQWLKQYIDDVIHYHDIEQKVVSYGANYYQVMHNASNYCRAFRQLKEKREELHNNGISIKEVKTDSKAGAWKVVKYGDEYIC